MLWAQFGLPQLAKLFFRQSLDPVKVTLRVKGWRTNASPTSCPYPVATFKTPAAKPASWATHANYKADSDAISEYFMTTVLPAANAGARFQTKIIEGEFHGVITTATPNCCG